MRSEKPLIGHVDPALLRYTYHIKPAAYYHSTAAPDDIGIALHSLSCLNPQGMSLVPTMGAVLLGDMISSAYVLRSLSDRAAYLTEKCFQTVWTYDAANTCLLQ